jgi:hypothetical protein
MNQSRVFARILTRAALTPRCATPTTPRCATPTTPRCATRTTPRRATRATLAALVALAALSSWTAPASAGDDRAYDPRIADLVTAADYPDDGAVVLLDRKHHLYDLEQGKIERTFAVKLLTQEGIDDFGDFLSYVFHESIEYEVKAVVVSPNGKRKDVGSKHKKKVDIGDDYYQQRIAFPGIEPGSVIEIREKYRASPAPPYGHWDFGHDVPTIRSELVYKVPAGAGVTFNFTPKGYLKQPKPVSDDRYEVYTVTMEVLPPSPDEPYMPRRYEDNPSVFYSLWQITQIDFARFHGMELGDRELDWLKQHNIPFEIELAGNDWLSIGKFYYGYFDPHKWGTDDNAREYDQTVADIASGYEVDPTKPNETVLDEIVSDFHDRFHPIERDFRYENPEETLAHNEGGPFELAYVLKRILDELDFQAYIVLAGDADEGLIEERNPNLSALEHPLVLVDAVSEYYWIDPAAPACGVNQLPWQCQGVKALMLKGEGDCSFVTTPWDTGDENCVVRRENIEVDAAGGLLGTSRITVTGQYLLTLRRDLEGADPDGESEPVQNLLAGLFPDEAALADIAVEVDEKDSVVVSCRYKIDDFAEVSGSFMNLDFSDWCAMPARKAFESETREHEIMFPYVCTRSATVQVTIPPEYTIEHKPGNTDYADGWFNHQRLCFQNGDMLVFTRTFAIKYQRIPAEDYQKAKAAVEQIQKNEKETIVLKRQS